MTCDLTALERCGEGFMRGLKSAKDSDDNDIPITASLSFPALTYCGDDFLVSNDSLTQLSDNPVACQEISFSGYFVTGYGDTRR